MLWSSVQEVEGAADNGVEPHAHGPLSSTIIQIPCLYVAPYLRYSCFPQFAPVWAVQDSNDSIPGEFWGKRLYLRNGATYKRGTYTILLLRTCTFQ